MVMDEEPVCNCSYCVARRKEKKKRFKVGDRVLASVESWCPGTVTMLDYSEDDWEHGRTSAYQILLDSECRFERRYVHAPLDVDEYVRPLPTSTVSDLGSAARPCQQNASRKCSRNGEACPLYHVCDDTVDCPKYHFCGREGRLKTKLWKRKAQRRVEQRGLQAHDGCGHGEKEADGYIEEKTIDAILDFVSGPVLVQGEVAAKKKKKKKKKRRRREIT